jgi:hypothetical protein
MTRVHKTPSEVSAEDGFVIVDGPDGVAYSMTPDAASETSDRLLYGAAEARGQQLPAPDSPPLNAEEAPSEEEDAPD